VAHPAGRPRAILVRRALAHNKKLGITSCTIITSPVVEPVSQIHDPMPVIFDQAAHLA
jgi:putative SOS response-associated peptidase YedK